MTKFVIGIDAGGSHTRALYGRLRAVKEMGVLQEAVLGPGNYRQIGQNGIQSLVRELIEYFDLAVAETQVVAGFSGAGTPESCSQIRTLFYEAGFCNQNVEVTSDAGLLMAALNGEGIVLIAGTGSICFGRTSTGGTEVRAGGYGYKMVSEAGGYRLGIQAIDAALKIADGRTQEPTTLYQAVCQNFGLKDLQKIVPHLYPGDHTNDEVVTDVREKVAGLAPAVFAAAAAGDGVAASLIFQMIDDLADHVRAVYNKLNSPKVSVGLYGGLFASCYAETLLLNPLMRHSVLSDLELKFLMLSEADNDPLLTAMRSVVK